MTGELTRRERCRLCDGRQLELCLPMEPSPIGDAFITAEQLGVPQPIFPLDLYLCRSCGHVQNLDVVDPELLFREYIYNTSNSPWLVKHFRHYVAEVCSRIAPPPDSLVVEIGSNDGTLLRLFREAGMRVLGVDPAREIARRASRAGIETLDTFFTAQLAQSIRASHGPAALVCANNVFAHADDLRDIAIGVRELLAEDGVFIFEVSYLVDIVDRMLFDTIYHEHLSHHTVAPLERFFRQIGLCLFDVQRVASKGGSIRCFVQHSDSGRRAAGPGLEACLAEERRRGFAEPAIYRQFHARIQQRKHELHAALQQEIRKGSMIAGYGASTTTTTLLWYFGLTRMISFIVDDNPVKHGRYSPGCHIPVVPSGELAIRRPDIVVVLAWQYADRIIERQHSFIASGGTFLVPLPNLRTV
ncbi:MAG: class I SAM-dependent methyltransferase [Zetaproteobacteria bacterium]|nr:MAG: class I SAM-dependent methyltransferase [Zetaproteobacteria bacterium]